MLSLSTYLIMENKLTKEYSLVDLFNNLKYVAEDQNKVIENF
jgi:hypothetical protein